MNTIGVELKRAGFRVTEGRTKLLKILKSAGKPMSIRDILKRARGNFLNQVTLYRALEDLSGKGIVQRADLGSGIAHYEYAPGRHHHHLVCTDCGVMEDVEDCSLEKMQERVVQESRRFKSIYSHNVEFFGRCSSCLKTS